VAGAMLTTGNVTVAWAASDATSGLDHFELSLDGGAVTVLGPTEGNHTFAGLSQGSHTATLVAFDLAGHTTAVARSFTVDTTAPTASLSAPTPTQLFGTSSVQLTWTASDATSGIDHFEVRLDGGTPINVPDGTATYTFTGLSDGAHTLALKAFDRAGNTII